MSLAIGVHVFVKHAHCTMQRLEKCHRELSSLTVNLREKEVCNQLIEMVSCRKIELHVYIHVYNGYRLQMFVSSIFCGFFATGGRNVKLIITTRNYSI